MTPEEQARTIEEIERDLERLQALYNQYFMGIEKLEPTVQHKAVERKIQLLRKEGLRSTALRFRFQTQVQKFNTQQTFWRRICRQIEEGTYQRHVQRAKQRTIARDRASRPPEALSAEEAAAAQTAAEEPPSYDLDMSEFDLDEPFDRLTKEPMPAAPMPRDPAPFGGLDDPFDDTMARARLTTDPVTGEPIVERHVPPARSQGEPPSGAAERIPPQKGESELSEFFTAKPAPPPPPGAPRPRVAPKRPTRLDEPTRKTLLSEEVSKPRPAPAAGSTDFDEKRAQTIYRTYLVARKKTNEPVENLSYEKVAGTLRKKWQDKDGKVDFKVVIRDGKAIIKTVKKEEE